MNTTYNVRHLAVVLSSSVVLAIIIASLIGCGGGSGRQTLPGENPFSAWTGTGTSISTGTGTGTTTGTGTGGSTGTGTGSSTGTGTGTGTQTPAQLLNQGWAAAGSGNWSSALNSFQAILALPTATTAERDQANNGLGWAYTKVSSLEAGIPYFTAAAPNVGESRVGLAAALIHRADFSGFPQAITYLETEGINNPAFVYVPAHPIGVSNGEAHALLAYAYFWRNNAGDDQLARDQITAARAADRSATSSVAQIYAVLQNLGLSGIGGL